jgi:hypothetical protein
MKLGLVRKACHPSYMGGLRRGLPSEIHPRQKARPYLKNNLKQKGLETWLKK